MVTYGLLPVTCDGDLERMLEVPSNHPSINTLELFLEVCGLRMVQRLLDFVSKIEVS